MITEFKVFITTACCFFQTIKNISHFCLIHEKQAEENFEVSQLIAYFCVF